MLSPPERIFGTEQRFAVLRYFANVQHSAVDKNSSAEILPLLHARTVPVFLENLFNRNCVAHIFVSIILILFINIIFYFFVFDNKNVSHFVIFGYFLPAFQSGWIFFTHSLSRL
jgi:hypothetical protein